MYARPQVRIYLQWVMWVFDTVLHGKPYVIVNMDETSVSNLTSMKAGYVSKGAKAPSSRMREHKPDRDSTDLKTTLLGAVCSDPLLQPHLPQILLPKYAQKKEPPRRLKEYYEALGYPIEAWHETCGNNTTETVKTWLTTLRKVVHAFNPRLWIILLIDVCTCHLCEDTLKKIRSLGMLVVFIPARCTWFLQPLDVYVYAWLKRVLRRMYTTARLHAADGLLRNSDWVPMTGRAIHQVLTHVDWTNAFRRCGICNDVTRFRPILQNLLRQEPLVAERPNDQQLRCLLNKTTNPSTGYTVNWTSLILGFSDHVATLPADALPIPGGHHALTEVPWQCQNPPAGVCQRMVTVADALRWPMAAVHNLTPLLALPPAVSQAVPLEAIRESSPVRNTRSQRRPLTPGLLDQEYSATASSSTAPAPSSQGGGASRRRRS